MSEEYSKKFMAWSQSEADRMEWCRRENEVFLPSEPPMLCHTEMEMKIIYEEDYRNLKTIIKDKIKNNTLIMKYPHCRKTNDIYKEAEQIRAKNKKEKKGFLFITICPEEGKFGDKFIEEVKSIFSWSWVNEMIIVFEQRGNTTETMGKGAHTHILIKDWDNEISKATLQIQKKFKPYVGATLYGKKLEEVINVQQKKMEWLDDKMEYILGDKTDLGKPEKQAIDKLWRQKLNLQTHYCFDNSTDKKELSIKGGKRKNCGVKKGTKRGHYKKKQNNIHLDITSENEIQIEHKNVKFSF